jgi:DNA-binding transcriptional LysR family regulator
MVNLRYGDPEKMQNWDEIKTAFHVARLGTVSAAADVLGVHHSTVIRHIDALEGRLKVKLFQRHARGYTPTDAGRDVMQVAQATDEQFQQLTNRLVGQGDQISGDIVLTSLADLTPDLMPVLGAFQQKYPLVNLTYLTDERVFRLAYGEAHVAIRAGRESQDQDNIVQHLFDVQFELVADQSYLDHFAPPQEPADLLNHRLIGFGAESRAPHYRWLYETLPQVSLSLKCADTQSVRQAVKAGLGLGFLPAMQARQDGFVTVMRSPQEWRSPIWCVTHVDLHRAPKVHALVRHLKTWGKTYSVQVSG